MNKKRLDQILVELSTKVIEKEHFYEYLNNGHNGPYNDPETPVRNSGHWLITFSKCYELTGDIKYKNKVLEIAEYLSSEKARPYNFSFYHREKKGKDKCNGLMGQAWTIESLVKATEVLGDEKYRKLAAEVFNQHDFDYKYGLWYRREIDGTVLSMDETFNHQLWFAACGGLIGNSYPEVMKKINRFIESLNQNVIILDSGLIHHHIERLRDDILSNYKNEKTLLSISKLRYNPFLQNIPFFGMKLSLRIKKQMLKSIGYHSFNMFAFALLKSSIPENNFLTTHRFKNAVDYMLKDEYIELLKKNKYSYPYNPPGFEIPYALSLLKKMNEHEFLEISGWWVNKQFQECYNKKTGFFDRNTYDSVTHTARIYELTRLPSDILNKIEITDYNE